MTSNQNNDDGYTLLAARLENAASSLQGGGKLPSSSFLEDLFKAIAILKRMATNRVRARSEAPKRISGSAFEGIANDRFGVPSSRAVTLDSTTPPRRKPGLGLVSVLAIGAVIIGGAIGLALLARHAVNFSDNSDRGAPKIQTEMSEGLSMQ